MKNHSILIGISGGTGSGKTSIAKAICDDINSSQITLIEQDAYYKDLSNLTMNKRSKVNFDHPDSIDYELLKIHIKELIQGNSINIPIYDFTTHTRKKETRLIENYHIIILEGILTLFFKDIRDMMTIKIFVDTSDDIRIIRRIKRDLNKRKRTFSSIIEQYYNSVRPMHIKFVEPTKKYADIIIPGESENTIAVDIIRTKILSLISDNNTVT